MRRAYDSCGHLSFSFFFFFFFSSAPRVGGAQRKAVDIFPAVDPFSSGTERAHVRARRTPFPPFLLLYVPSKRLRDYSAETFDSLPSSYLGEQMFLVRGAIFPQATVIVPSPPFWPRCRLEREYSLGFDQGSLSLPGSKRVEKALSTLNFGEKERRGDLRQPSSASLSSLPLTRAKMRRTIVSDGPLLFFFPPLPTGRERKEPTRGGLPFFFPSIGRN